jgi:hypothetical protein
VDQTRPTRARPKGVPGASADPTIPDAGAATTHRAAMRQRGAARASPTQTNAFTVGYPRSQVITLILAVSVLRKPWTLHPSDAEMLAGRRLHHHPPPQTAHHLSAQVL